jgi:hypothetical protein
MSSAAPSAFQRTFGLQSLKSEGLALVPLVVAAMFGALVFPRGVAPEEIPLPTIDARALSAVEAADDLRTARVREDPLPARVRALGSAYRLFNAAEGAHSDEVKLTQAHEAIFTARRQTMAGDLEALKTLRAVELSGFLAEVHRFERTGEQSSELHALGGTFIDRMTQVGWCSGRHLAMPDPALRAAFKLTWNRVLELERDASFALTLDETRALYSFYFTHPRATNAGQGAVDASTSASSAAVARGRANDATRKAKAGWLLGKIAELSRVDPTYPVDLARASALFMRRDFRASALLYEEWLQAHPDGLWTLRVQNHLRAALLAEGR